MHEHGGPPAAFGSFDEEAVARLRKAIGRMARALNQSATLEDLTPTQASVLQLVVVRGRVGLSELAGIEGINPTMLSRVVSRLDTLGLIERSADEADQRAVVVAPTEAGREASLHIRDQRTRELLAVVEQLSGDTAATLLAALPAFEALAEAMRRPATERTP
ncbi:MarR family winged helix-turn-helix transcriptional regulator [Pseudonocardia ailaonensis]